MYTIAVIPTTIELLCMFFYLCLLTRGLSWSSLAATTTGPFGQRTKYLWFVTIYIRRPYVHFALLHRITMFREVHIGVSTHCKYIQSNYDGITVYHRTSTIFRCNVPLHLNIPIAKIRYPKIYHDMIVKCH